MAKLKLDAVLAAQRGGRKVAVPARSGPRDRATKGAIREGKSPKRISRRMMFGAAAGAVGGLILGRGRAIAQQGNCNGTPYNPATQCCISCGGFWRVVNRTSTGTCNWGCCWNGSNGNPYDPATQCCVSCGGFNRILNRLPNGTCNWGCCWNGFNGTPYDPGSQCCSTCGGTWQVIPRTSSNNCQWGCCQNGQFYDGALQCCLPCGGRYSVINRLPNGSCQWGCCNGNFYNPGTQYCCAQNRVCNNGQNCINGNCV
jgi:hypothetical protein